MTDLEQLGRRKYERFQTDALVWWSRDWEPEPIALLDISAGGMLVEFPEEMRTREKVSLHFEFPDHEGLILCHCRVVHCRAQENFYWVGLRIIELEGMRQNDFIKRLRSGKPPLAGAKEEESGEGED